MGEDFNRLIGIAIRNSKTSSIKNKTDFVKKSRKTRRIISKIYQENPNATKEQINKQMQDILEEILEQTIKFKDLKSYLIRRNILNYLRLHPEEIERVYTMIGREEKAGKKINSPETIVYSVNTNKAIRQVVANAMFNLRFMQETLGEVEIKAIQQLDTKEKQKLKERISENTKSKKEKEESIHAVNMILLKTDLERVKYYILNMYRSRKSR